MRKLQATKIDIEKYLLETGWIEQDEELLTIENPGDGNMNFTLRVITSKNSFILKQSRGYVEKYPQVEAPEDRVLREAEFYAVTAIQDKLRSYMPAVLDIDEENHILKLEDLGKGVDYTYLYAAGGQLSQDEIVEIMQFISHLHLTCTKQYISTDIKNLHMRKLNHEHIFLYPYIADNGLDLDSITVGLNAKAKAFYSDEVLKKKVGQLGVAYLSDGPVLLHGDYFPGSWLKTQKGLKVIDPEFCYFGQPEFEIGVTIAHLKMAQQPQAIIDTALDVYTANAPLDKALREKYTAIEIIRRIIGLAQLPLALSLDEKSHLLEESHEVLLR